jgi:DNA polymerase-3 subunit gamma/tau
VKYAPASSRFKIYIIDEVHMLSTAAFNALLKTLEEPPAHVKFMFATTEPEKVLATILSRCQRFDLRRIPLNLISRHIQHIAEQENVRVDENALHAIARGADGCMRDAESTLDQLISFCGDEVVEEDVLSMFGLTARTQLAELAHAILSGDAPAALGGLNELAASGKELGRLLTDLLTHFRNLLLFQVSGGDLTLLEASEAEADTLSTQSQLADAPALNRILEVFAEAEMRFRDAASRKILFEVTLMKAIEARNAVNIESVLQTLEGLRAGAPSSPAPAPAATPRSSSRSSSTAPGGSQPPVRTAPAPSPSPTPEAADLSALWTQLLDSLARASKFAHAYLVQAHPVSMARSVLTIGFDPEFEDQIGLADNSKTHKLLQTKLAELGHPGMMVKFVIAAAPGHFKPAPPAADDPEPPRQEAVQTPPVRDRPDPRASKRPAPPSFSKEDFKKDPLIQKALEVFKGQIVDIRG